MRRVRVPWGHVPVGQVRGRGERVRARPLASGRGRGSTRPLVRGRGRGSTRPLVGGDAVGELRLRRELVRG